MSARLPYVQRPTRRRERCRAAPAPAVELLDDAEVAARVASGELRRLTDFGPTPVDEIAVAELRDEMERRRLGDRDYEPQEPRDNGARS